MSECEDCGADDQQLQLRPGGGERCVDRKGCAVRAKAERAGIVAEVLDEVGDAAEGLRAARAEVKGAERHLAHEIKAAIKEGASVTALARASGLSRERIYQIRDGRR